MTSKSSFRLSVLAAATALALASPAFAQGRLNLDGLRSEPSVDRFIVKYRVGTAPHADIAALQQSLNTAARALAPANGSSVSLQRLRRLAVGADVIKSARKLDRVEAEMLMRQLAADPNVEYVEVDRKLQPLSTPNDSRYNEQWHYFETTGGLNLPTAWDISTGSGVVIADIDTGITSHSDLNANVLAGYDFISDVPTANDGDGRDSDPSDPGDADSTRNSSWHGTHTAGTLAAVGNNSKGVVGVAYGAKLVPLRVLGKGGGYTSDISDAIVWASGGTVSGVPANANPAVVINMSLGGSGSCDSTEQTAINTAVGNGTTVVVAAGNSNSDSSGFTPASCNNVVAVAATNRAGSRASYSNYGTKVDVSAPGGETSTQANGVLSTLNSGASSPGSESYAFYQGTSMATPHVAGVVALMEAVAPSLLTPAQVETILKDTARALPGSCSGGCGAGIVDAAAAVTKAKGGTTNKPPVADFTVTTSGLTASFTDKSSDSDGSIASRSWDFGDSTTSTATSPSKTYSSAGTYTVKLTVTEDKGATNTKSQDVTVGSSSGSVLTNGKPVTGLSAATGASLRYTMDVPAGAGGLKFVTSGGTGDADLYVKFGADPTTSSYDCKSDGSTTAETCSIPTAQTGTYHVLVYGYSAFSGVSLTGSYSTAGGGAQTYSNAVDYPIRDLSTVDSPITVSGRTGNAPSNAQVAVSIVHTYRGDLQIDLIAPDGSAYRLKNSSPSDSADNVNATYTVNLSTEALNGTWKLRVKDVEVNDTGYIDSWSVTF